ncbi:hypothetical protein OO007_09430 [Cocleimonas sp. KMM 6892]|uniref:ApeP family dehydratase n=1 Tax=unclassified Cocleimonas TaxID=2639732 RepID=UPI002DB9C0CC|nr:MULTISPECIES: hypothetical protein [unclassified Cocleimonas]MEB8432443.1 hypothetical protein [Cocleimonas sp. KMM 6892]MEC4715302.1 hypothetical protein [Cocleimonas sp. KMM 6895]MEC4745079.1 hypothetical protein [Cocleimonas sp. KMM 6896]
MSDLATRFDPEILTLIPHRPPMLLINRILEVGEKQSSAEVFIDKKTPFYEKGLGVPATIGLEFMGQTAALIAGNQVIKNPADAKLGFLLGTRKYQSTLSYFKENSVLVVECSESAMVGETLASFSCTIRYKDEAEIIASANLSVLRQPINKSPAENH